MNILVLPSWYKTPLNPTLGSFFTEQAIGLVQRGHQVDVMFCHGIKSDEKLLKPSIITYDDHGVQTHMIYIKPKVRKTGTIIQIINSVAYAIKLVKTQKIDIIHAHSTLGGFIAYGVKLFTGIPYVYTEHSTNFARGLMIGKEKWMTKKALTHASSITAVSEPLKNQMMTLTSHPVHAISNMVQNRFFETPLKPTTESSSFHFFSCAYLTHKKGFDILIKAFSNVVKLGHSMTLSIGGDGEEKDHLQQLVNELNLQNHVNLLGSLSRCEVLYHMQQSDAFVLTSRYETFGIVYLEALACGKPIVMTKTDAYQRIVNDDNGIAIEIDDIEACSQALIKIQQNSHRYNPLQIRTHAYTHFSQEVILSQYERLYTQVLRREK